MVIRRGDMSDSKFYKLMIRLKNAQSKYVNLLNKAEFEYKKRFGEFPSDIEDDNWIDIFHAGYGTLLELDEMIKRAKNRSENFKKTT